MTNQPESVEVSEPQVTNSAAPQELHSLQDLPNSLGEISRGPLGSVARKDHVTWRTRGLTDPSYWYGRVDTAIGENLKARPIPTVAIWFGIGLMMGVFMGGSQSRSSWH